MCLTKVLTSKNIILRHLIAYKDFRLVIGPDNKYKLSPLYCGEKLYDQVHHVYKQDVCRYIKDDYNNTYMSGYHAYVNQFPDLHKYYVRCLVIMHNVHTFGVQYSYLVAVANAFELAGEKLWVSDADMYSRADSKKVLKDLKLKITQIQTNTTCV